MSSEEQRLAPSTSAAPRQGAAVVPSGEALRVASAWLGITDPLSLLEEEESKQHGLGTEARPPGLGLGAKFLPHKKAVLLAKTAECSLGRKLGVYKKPLQGRGIGDRMEGTNDAGDQQEESDPDGEDDDMSRATAFVSGESAKNKEKSAATLRAELLEKIGGSKRCHKRKRR